MTVHKVAPCRPADDARCTWIPAGYTYAAPQVDDTLGRCGDCGCEIWVGPRKQAAAHAGLAKLICWPCTRPYYERSDVVTEVNLHPGKPNRPRR